MQEAVPQLNASCVSQELGNHSLQLSQLCVTLHSLGFAEVIQDGAWNLPVLKKEIKHPTVSFHFIFIFPPTTPSLEI